MMKFTSKCIQRAIAASKAAGKNHHWLYANYSSKEQDEFAGYRQASLQRLRAIQRSVDLQGVFTSTGLCRGYIKLL